MSNEAWGFTTEMMLEGDICKGGCIVIFSIYQDYDKVWEIRLIVASHQSSSIVPKTLTSFTCTMCFLTGS